MKRLAVVLLIALVSGCAVAPRNGMMRATDGVEVFYDVRGRGDVAVIFVHCWACNRLFWHQQRDAFAEDYRVVTFDLPGHGQSGADRPLWSVNGLSHDVVAVVDELELDKVILVGHSMGGPVSVAAAPLLGDRLLGIVLVDTMQNVEFQFPPEAVAQWVAGFEQDFDGQLKRGVNSMFPEDANDILVNWVVVQARQTDHTAAVSLMRDFANLDPPGLLESADVPVRAINSAATERMGLPTAREVNRKYADYDAVIMEGTGHYPQLERPDEFNHHLAAILKHLARG